VTQPPDDAASLPIAAAPNGGALPRRLLRRPSEKPSRSLSERWRSIGVRSMRRSVSRRCWFGSWPRNGVRLVKRIKRAGRLLLGALERDTNRSTAHYSMHMLRRVQNRLTEARIEFETTIALDRNHARSFFRPGQTLMYRGRPDAGIPPSRRRSGLIHLTHRIQRN
jgi:hypothetical protein